MKYSEFEKRITERLGFKVENLIESIFVYAHDSIVARVTKEEKYVFGVGNGNHLTDDEARYLAQMCHELACTPLEEREEEKKYRIRHKYLSESLNYLNYEREIKCFKFHNAAEIREYKTKFTKSELVDLLPLNLYGSICNSEIYEWEEVE